MTALALTSISCEQLLRRQLLLAEAKLSAAATDGVSVSPGHLSLVWSKDWLYWQQQQP